VEYFSAIWVQPETPILRQEVPSIPTEAPDILQEMPNNLQETPNIMQETQEYSWRDLQFDEEADAQVETHFCGKSDKDPTKPSRAVLLQLLLKEKVASGRLVIDGIVDGIPVIIRGGRSPGDVDPEDTFQSQPQSQLQPYATHSAAQPQSQSQSQSQSQFQPQPHAQARLGTLGGKCEAGQGGIGQSDEDRAGDDAGRCAGGHQD
jgi:hypothetical protein